MAQVGDKDVVLYIDHVQLKGVTHEPTNPATNQLIFHLTRNATDKDGWAQLLGRPRGFEKQVEVSVGQVDTYPLATDVDDFTLIVILKGRALFTLLSVLALAMGLFYLAKNTNILKDNTPKIGNLPRPFSLARSQMALWFLLTMIAMVVIWAITGGLDGPTASVLSLIGIGSGTALGAALVESGKESKDDAADQVQLTQAHQDWKTLDTGLKAAREKLKTGTDAEAKKLLATDLEGVIEQRTALVQNLSAEGYVSEGFVQDILSDRNGVSFHRFQMVVLTLLLGFVFLVDVFQKLAMPEFDGTLLSLMGISSGTYLGFKFPEKT